jgi:hypothetical protein
MASSNTSGVELENDGAVNYNAVLSQCGVLRFLDPYLEARSKQGT